jgi:hypothetical protein
MHPTRQASLFATVLAAGMLLGVDAHRSLAQSAPLAAPALRLARGEDGKATLAFAAVAGANGYAVRVIDGDGKQEVIDHVEVTDYTVHGLANGRDYRFAVCAVADGRKGPWSNELSATPADQPGWSTLREAFTSRNPTRNSNPFTMVHGKESEAELRTILRVAYDAGFEGVTLHPYNYEDYLGPGQWQRWKIILDQARRLGLVVWQQDDRNYPSGFAAGKVLTAHPELGRTTLAEAAKHVLTGPRKDFALDIASLVKGRDILVAITAYPENGEPVDLTDRVSHGKLAWDVPTGSWTLFVVKAIWCGPGETGDMASYPPGYIDFMNPRAVDAYIQAIYQASFEQFGPEFGRTFKGFFSDEAPVGFRQFTPDLLERFEKAKGYSIRKHLPSLWHDLGKLDRKVRCDYRDFLREQNTTVFFGRSRQWCRDHGIQFIGHVIEDHQQDMRRLESLDFPGFDNVFGQWYDPDPDVYWRDPRMTSSVAHYSGVRNDIALVEHFAATGWRTGLSEMKRMMDWSTVMGINQVVPCGLDTQSPPSWEVTPDFWLHGKNPQWPYFPAYQAVANRMTMLMRGGRHVAPAILLDTTESQWVQRGADLSPAGHSAADDLWKSCAAMSQAHVDFDLIPYYVFSDGARSTFEKGRVRIGKEDYRAVVLPGVEFIPAAVAERLRAFYDAGGIVVAIGRTPNASCNGQDDARVRAAVEGIWGAKASPKGKSAITTYEKLDACLAGLNVPDVRIPPQFKNLLYCHRQLHGKDLYFFANMGDQPIATTVELRRMHGMPSLWEPVRGEIYDLSSDSIQKDALGLPLRLGEFESVFVVVDPDGQRPTVVNHSPAAKTTPQPVQEIALQSPWQARNGSAAYHRVFSTEFRLPSDWSAGSPAILELRGASQILHLQVNGKPAGRQFCSPYRFEVGKHLRPGVNRIEVERIGRYSSPVEVANMGKLSYTDDNAATSPCKQAILIPRTESIRATPISGGPGQ